MPSPLALANQYSLQNLSQAIEDRLNKLRARPEEDITQMMDASSVVNNSRTDQPLSHALKLERDYLVELGSLLGRCAEKLVCLALQDARRMSKVSSPVHEAARQWAYFVGALTPALDHTEIESKGVGCSFAGGSAESAMAMAQALRQEMKKVEA